MQTTIVAIGVALLGASALADVAYRRIPNPLPVAIAVLGLAGALLRGGATSAALHLGVAVLVAVVLILGWRARLLGGGDVKLAVACTCWLGPSRVVTFAAATAIAGGVVALLTLAASIARPAIAPGVTSSSRAPFVPRTTVPYGVAIGLGATFAALS